jgi:hypothetical protein
MTDVLFVLLTLAFFALAALYVRACARILGTEDHAADLVEPEPEPAPVDADRAAA